MNGAIDYDFKAVNYDDYELKLVIPVEDRTMRLILQKSKSALEKAVAKRLEEKEINEFEVPKQYLNFLKTSIGSKIREVKSIVKKDKIIVLNDKVTGCKFKREGINWRVEMKIEGQYVEQ